MTFEDGLRALVPRNNVRVEQTVSGTIRITLGVPVSFLDINEFLRAHDMTMQMAADGRIELTPLTTPLSTGSTNITATKTAHVTSGAIRQVTYTGPTATSADLAAIAARPDVLNVMIASNEVVVNEIIPTDVKNGLSHLKYKNGLKRGRPAGKTWPTKSRALANALRARRQASWTSKFARLIW